jgi:hypothetical protein
VPTATTSRIFGFALVAFSFALAACGGNVVVDTTSQHPSSPGGGGNGGEPSGGAGGSVEGTGGSIEGTGGTGPGMMVPGAVAITMGGTVQFYVGVPAPTCENQSPNPVVCDQSWSIEVDVPEAQVESTGLMLGLGNLDDEFDVLSGNDPNSCLTAYGGAGVGSLNGGWPS